MPLTKLNFKPGINKEETDYANEGGWVDGDKIRFRKGRVEKIGGWEKLSSDTLIGSARALHSWISLGGRKYLGIGTTNKYYIEEGGTYNDVTPVRKNTTNAATFAATNGSSTLTVTDAGHGAVNGDFVTFSSAVSLGGNITAAVINQEYQISLVTGTNTYEITAKDTSGSTVTANASDSGNGGSATDAEYLINSGLDVYVPSTGWGVGTWGAGSWGSATALSDTNQLRLWTHDNYGENLIINPRAGGIYRWVENDGLTTRAVELSAVSGANLVPTKALQVITSETDRHLIVLGADPISGSSRTGTLDPMLIAFSDQENELQFEPLTTNTAGSLRLSSGSSIVGGIKARQEILIWTDTSLYSMNFIGPPLTFAVNLINEGAGLIGPKAAVNSPKGVFYMSKKGFYYYNGAVQKLPCSVQDYIFSDLDETQAYKCFAGLNEEFSEIWFFYPSLTDNETEISRYAIYNYEENSWSIGSLERYSWLAAGVLDRPLAAGEDSSTKYIYEHEKGFNNDTSSMDGVFIESADIDIADGDRFVFLKRILPDILFVNDVGTSQDPAINVVVKRRDFSNQTLSTDSTTQIKSTSTFGSLRSRGRQFVLRFESDDDNTESDRKNYKWRLGNTRVEIQPSGRR
jgi:uncharacterized protein YdeI (BOF family)|tara:strand:+ start:2443 stop:4335 length:1893 start_codon:yes stop_codon:yes gene_type:complete